MKQNISELAGAIYRVKQQSDIVIGMYFARVFKNAILNEHLFYVPMKRHDSKTITPVSLKKNGRLYITVFTDLPFVCVADNIEVKAMKMFQILQILKHNEQIYGISLNPFYKEYSLEINRKNFANIWQFQA